MDHNHNNDQDQDQDPNTSLTAGPISTTFSHFLRELKNEGHYLIQNSKQLNDNQKRHLAHAIDNQWINDDQLIYDDLSIVTNDKNNVVIKITERDNNIIITIFICEDTYILQKRIYYELQDEDDGEGTGSVSNDKGTGSVSSCKNFGHKEYIDISNYVAKKLYLTPCIRVTTTNEKQEVYQTQQHELIDDVLPFNVTIPYENIVIKKIKEKFNSIIVTDDMLSLIMGYLKHNGHLDNPPFNKNSYEGGAEIIINMIHGSSKY